MHIIFICEYFAVVALSGLYGGSGMLQFGIAAKSEMSSGIAQPVDGWGC